MQNIKYFSEVKPGLYKIDVNSKFTKNEIKNMVETLFNVQVLKVNTLRRHHYKRSLLNQLSPAPQIFKRAFVKTEIKSWKLQKAKAKID